MVAAKSRKVGDAPIKYTDERAAIRCAAGIGEIREEVWKDKSGTVVRYNLTFINHHLFAGDNGRVLGYDTAHGYAHRHFAGGTEATEPATYNETLNWFLAEVDDLKRRARL